jgi:hypothetical protein
MTKRILLLTFVLLQLGDVFTTSSVLAAGGREANPVMAAAMASLGSLWWLPKMAVALACVVMLVQGRTRYIAAGVALMSVIVINNSIDLAILGVI